MREPPALSVVVPCFNAEATIGDSLSSVFGQRLPPGATLQVIVADDGSTDGSRAAATRFPVLWLPAANTGPAAARNRGLGAAGGEFVCFLDADDCYAPGFFQAALETFADDPGLAAVLTGIELIHCHRDVHPVQIQAMVLSLPSNMMVRRIVAERIGGFPEDRAFRGIRSGEDLAFKHVLCANFPAMLIDRPFLRYRVRRGSHFDLFMDSTRVIEGALKVIADEAELATIRAAVRAYAQDVAARLMTV